MNKCQLLLTGDWPCIVTSQASQSIIITQLSPLLLLPSLPTCDSIATRQSDHQVLQQTLETNVHGLFPFTTTKVSITAR